MRVGFIGLGQMGSAIAVNLIRAGHEVTVWNRSSSRADRLVEAGAQRADRPIDAAQGDVAMSMLADDAAVEGVVYSEGGILGAPALHLSLSTISVALAERLTADHRLGAYLSAPVFGRPPAAEAAKLFVATAGASDVIDRCDPLFAAISQRVFRVGDVPSTANLVKLCGNFMIMAIVEALSETMALAQKGGVGRDALLDVLTGTLFDAPAFRTYGQILVEDRFRPAGFPAPLGLKDMNLADAAATASRVSMPLLSIVRDHLRATIAQEGDDIDWAGMALTVRRGALSNARGYATRSRPRRA